jgi:hypothetical protein
MSEIEKPRGILNQKAGEEKFRLIRLAPAVDLSFFVERYWIVSWDLRGQEPYVQETLPYPCVNLVFERDNTYVHGVKTGKFSRLLENDGRVFGIKFRPGAFYPFIKAPVSKFTDGCMSFREAFVLDGKALEEAILEQGDVIKMRATAENFLRERLPEVDENVRKINLIVDYIIAHQEVSRVEDIVGLFDLNKRTLLWCRSSSLPRSCSL